MFLDYPAIGEGSKLRYLSAEGDVLAIIDLGPESELSDDYTTTVPKLGEGVTYAVRTGKVESADWIRADGVVIRDNISVGIWGSFAELTLNNLYLDYGNEITIYSLKFTTKYSKPKPNAIKNDSSIK